VALVRRQYRLRENRTHVLTNDPVVTWVHRKFGRERSSAYASSAHQ
jgi:hypothetical protein